MWRWVKAAILALLRTHLPVGVAIVGLVSVIISQQISNRSSFANSELHQDVTERWGAPIEQPAPSVRYVSSGSVFNSLTPLALDKQSITVNVFYPEQDRFVVEWETRGEAVPPPKAVAKPTAVEPVITAAQASVVCTLDGFQIARIVYDLRLQGTQQIGLVVPRNSTLARVLLNGTPVPFAVQDGAVQITVVPTRPGDESARLELVVHGARREFHLSGRLHFAFPAASWSTHVLAVALHLPVVFEYAWAGGSLAPADRPPDAELETDLPMPGKILRFRQELISSSPDVAVNYTVDLKGQYFGG